MAALAMTRPCIQAKPSKGALTVVATRESTTPRNVFDCPKIGRPSTNTTPRSTGRSNRVPKSLPPMTGNPFAIISRTTTLKTRRHCIATNLQISQVAIHGRLVKLPIALYHSSTRCPLRSCHPGSERQSDCTSGQHGLCLVGYYISRNPVRTLSSQVL